MHARLVVSTLLVTAVLGCVHKPVTAPVAIVPATIPNEIRIAAVPARRFGDMTAFGVGLSNGSSDTIAVSALGIFAVDRAGNRIASLTVAEAARQAGGRTALVAGLQGAGGAAMLGAALGALPGAILGAASGGRGSGTGALVGAGIGAAVGAAAGLAESKPATDEQINEQLTDLYLGEKTLEPGLPASGFVFFPAGTYFGVEAVVVSASTNQVREVGGSLLAAAS